LRAGSDILEGPLGTPSGGWERTVTRILDAMKQAEKERLRESQKSRAERPKDDGADRRKSKRWAQPVPVLVYGSDVEKQPFHEKAETIDINDDGCLLTLESAVAAGQHLFLTNMRNRLERECIVVHVGKRVQGKARVGVNFLRPLRDGALPGPVDFWQAV
jgi:DNA invertase Pin-like site-specific DNA recombinase